MRFYSGVSNYKETPYIISDTFANKSSYVATTKGAIYICRDGASLSEPSIYQANGTIWVPIGSYGIGTDATLEDVTTNGNTTDKGIQITAGGLSTNSLTDTALTAKSVPFVGTGGLITQDNTNFVWDNVNKWLGIQTNTPTAELDLHSTTTTPIISLNNTAGNASNILFQNTNVNKWRLGNNAANAFVLFNNNLTSTAMSIKSSDSSAYFAGFVGINQSAPSYNLDVNGITNLGGVTNIQTGNNLFYLQNNGATTGWTANKAQNTGGSFIFGLNGSAAGGIASGATAYATVLYSTTNVELYSGGVKRLTLDSATGDATFVNKVFNDQSIGYKVGIGGSTTAGYTVIHSASGTGTEGIALNLSTGGASQLNFPSTGTYSFTFPTASGTLATTGNLSNYLPLAGGTLTGVLNGTSALFQSDNVTLNVKSNSVSTPSFLSIGNSDISKFISIYGGTSVDAVSAIWWKSGQSLKLGTASSNNGSSESIKMTITDVGYVGIGTNNPLNKLVISNGGLQGLEIGADPTNNVNLAAYNRSTSSYIPFQIDASKYSFLTGNLLIGSTIDDTVNKLQVTGSSRFYGNVGIGTNPSVALDIIGRFRNTLTSPGTTVLEAYNPSATGYGAYISGGVSTNYSFQIADYANNVRFTVLGNGTTTIANLAGTGSRAVLADASGNLSAPVSDQSVKENVQSLKYGLDTIMQLNPVQFEYIDSYKNYGEGLQIGAIAQEVEQIIPEAVFKTPSTGLKGIDYSQFNGIYIKAIQDQQKIIESLIQRIELLENK